MLCSVKFRSKIIMCKKGKFLKHNHDYKLGNTLQSVQPQLAMCGISSFIDIAIIKGYCINIVMGILLYVNDTLLKYCTFCAILMRLL